MHVDRTVSAVWHLQDGLPKRNAGSSQDEED